MEGDERGGSAAAQEGRYLQQLRFVVVAVAARRGQDLFPLGGHVLAAARDGDANGVMIARGGPAFGHGGSIDALDDGLNACGLPPISGPALKLEFGAV